MYFRNYRLWKNWLEHFLKSSFSEQAFAVNTLTADDKDPVQDSENLPRPIQMQLSGKRKLFLSFLFHLWNLHQILNILKIKMIVIGNVFPKLQSVKKLVGTLSKEQRFRIGFCSQHVKPSEILAKSPWECFDHAFLSLLEKLISKLSPSVLCEILLLFFNTLTADDKYPFLDSENLPLRIQKQLSGKRKNYSEFFVPYLECTSNFQHFKRKNDLYR